MVMICPYALQVEEELEPGPYSDAAAERCARRLMPGRDFGGALELADHRLAEALNVPLEQIVRRRGVRCAPAPAPGAGLDRSSMTD
jgi:hypothetical protein